MLGESPQSFHGFHYVDLEPSGFFIGFFFFFFAAMLWNNEVENLQKGKVRVQNV